jgi:hypothetical protein
MALIKQYTCKFILIRALICNSSCTTTVLSKIEHNLCSGEWRDRQTRKSNEPSDKGRNFVVSILGDTVYYYFLFYKDCT